MDALGKGEAQGLQEFWGFGGQFLTLGGEEELPGPGGFCLAV